MQTYEVRRGHGKNLEGDGLKAILGECFGEVRREGDRYLCSYGALESLAAWFDGKGLHVDTQMKNGVADDIAAMTIKAYNTFLERATGYSAKERAKRAQRKAKDGKL